MTYYLVDTGNVAQRWTASVAKAETGDVFLLFYSHNVGAVSMSAFGPGCLKGVRFEFVGCSVGTNAMDFQICTELGRLVALHPDAAFRILSGDGGFDAVVHYWEDRGVNVRREPLSISKDADGELSVRNMYKGMLREIGLTGDDQAVAAGILVAAMRLPQNERKLNALNRFTKRYGAEEGRARYAQVKDLVRHISMEGPFPPPEAKDGKDAIPAMKPAAKKPGRPAKPVPAESKAKPSPKRLSDQVRAAVPGLEGPDVSRAANAVNRARQKGDKTTLLKELERAFGKSRAAELHQAMASLMPGS